MTTIAVFANEPEASAIDREIEGGFPAMRFSPDLEKRYEADTRTQRERHLRRSHKIGIVLYNVFLFSDWQMMPDIFTMALVVRLGILTPVFVISYLFIKEGSPRLVRESVASGLAVLAVALLLCIMPMSHSPDVLIYQYGNLLGILYTAAVLRLPLRYATVTIGSLLTGQFIAVAHLHNVTPKLIVTVVLFYAIGGLLMLWSSYALESEQRRSYLLELRSRILNNHLDQIAKRDALTGLWNRRHLDTVLKTAWASAVGAPRPMSVILLDIDHFKSFNDSQGHVEGDKCLERVANCVRSAVECDDKAVAIRFGGEEFLVFVEGANSRRVEDLARRIQASIKCAAIPHPALGDGAVITASLGIATGTAPGLPTERLIAAADNHLYAAKRSGRDRIWPSDPAAGEAELRIAS